MAEDRFKALGNRIRELRMSSGMSIRALEDSTGVSKTIISGMEKHGLDVKYSTLEKLAKGFGLSISELLNF